jgi:hypothetical protein
MLSNETGTSACKGQDSCLRHLGEIIYPGTGDVNRDVWFCVLIVDTDNCYILKYKVRPTANHVFGRVVCR